MKSRTKGKKKRKILGIWPRATVKTGYTFCVRLSFIYLVLLPKSRNLGKEDEWEAGEAKIEWNLWVWAGRTGTCLSWSSLQTSSLEDRGVPAGRAEHLPGSEIRKARGRDQPVAIHSNDGIQEISSNVGVLPQVPQQASDHTKEVVYPLPSTSWAKCLLLPTLTGNHPTKGNIGYILQAYLSKLTHYIIHHHRF